ncbi:hypothetical protein E8E14_014606 [Neopestalotiopsis sp. 37M]|nr:hypothetical protein E8E14_014606 [Neopestalotiopsis sp. 37M]
MAEETQPTPETFDSHNIRSSDHYIGFHQCRSANCGYIVWPNDSSSTGRVLELHSERLSNAANYAQQCYTTTSSGILGCARFVTDRLSWDEDNNAPCPFAEGMCRTNDSNIRLDTGLINVNRVLGLNLPANEGIAFRRVFSCAPLVTDGFTSVEQTMHGDIVSYHHGHWESGSMVRNYSFRIGDIDSQNSRHQDLDSALGLNFRLASIPILTSDGQVYLDPGLTFIPVPGLNRSDGDSVIVYLSADGVIFDQPMQDEWYRAQSPGGPPLEVGRLKDFKKYWVADEPATPLGCVMQHQYCNLALPTGSNCGPLGSFYDSAWKAIPIFNATDQGYSLLDYVYNLHAYGAPVHIYELLNHLGASSLASQSQLVNGRQYTSQPTTQWQSDVRHWFATLSAALQAAYIDTVLGPDDAELNNYRRTPEDQEQIFCNSQKARSSQFASFSVFGLYFTYVTGALIILVSVTIEPVLEYGHKRRGWQSYQQLEWTTNQQLQLLRLAYEESGHANWSKCTNFVPMTEKDEKLCAFDISQPDHPSVMRKAARNDSQVTCLTETPHSNDSLPSPPAFPVDSVPVMHDEAPSESIGGRTMTDGGSPEQTVELKKDNVQSELPLQTSDMASDIPDGDSASISIHGQSIESVSDSQLIDGEQIEGERC